jgi:carboxyl-terminal processing protease
VRKTWSVPDFLAFAALLAFAPLALAQAPTDQQIRRLVGAMQTIKQKFVDPITDEALFKGCSQHVGEAVGDRKLSEEYALPPQADVQVWLREFLVQQSRRHADLARRGELVEACLDGMLRALGGDAQYLREGEFLRKPPAQPQGAVGLEVGMREGRPYVVSVILNTPGERAGLQRGDILMRIDGLDTRGMTLAQSVGKMRGPVGSVAQLTIGRGEQVLELGVAREVISINTVRGETTPEGVLVLASRRVTYETPEHLVGAIERALRQGGQISGLVLDLRANTGGPIRPVVALAAAFLPPTSLVATTKGHDPFFDQRFMADASGYLDTARGGPDHLLRLPPAVKTLPLVVIVNRDSRSGAELVAAALQDHRRAKVVGEATQGFGLIQTITALEDEGALRLSSARMYRPSGQSIHARPVVPDVTVDLSKWRLGSKDDPALPAAMQALRQ